MSTAKGSHFSALVTTYNEHICSAITVMYIKRLTLVRGCFYTQTVYLGRPWPLSQSAFIHAGVAARRVLLHSNTELH